MFWYAVDPGFIVTLTSHDYNAFYKIQSIFPQAIDYFRNIKTNV